MCRIAGYIGPPIRLDRFLLEPDHALYYQSWQARELQQATVNADGFGFAWFVDGEPSRYVNSVPIWSDVNLRALGRSLESRVWLGNVRSATDGLLVHVLNTQPFVGDGLLFAHNGFIEAFARSMRRDLRAALEPDIEADIVGNTDSEHIFALLRHDLRASGKSLQDQALQTMAQLSESVRSSGVPALLNLIVTDGERLVVLRHAIDRDCPSLYACSSHPDYADAVLAASEPLDEAGAWWALEPHQMVVLTPGAEAQKIAL